MIVVMDQMQPGYAKQFNMTNVLWLQNKGVNFPTAWVGDMASETVVSHNVMVSGMFPKHMGWSDEAFRDVDNILGYGENAIVTSGDLGTSVYVKLIENMDYPKLGDYLHAQVPRQDRRQRGPEGLPGRVDGGFQLGLLGADGQQEEDRRPGRPLQPRQRAVDRHVPRSVGPACRPTSPATRASSSASATRVTPTAPTSTAPAWLYPEDGRYVVGPYEGHESGDNWVADAATKIMENEDWSGLWVTFSSIDKIGHMWGGGAVDTVANYGWDPASIFREIHMPWVAKNADDQLGKLIAKLKELDQFNDTLIVVTADHGSTYGAAADGFKGVNAYDGGNTQLVRRHVAPGLRHVESPNTSSGRRPQAADGHRQRGLQLPVHGDRDVAQGPQHDQEEGSRGRDGGPSGRDRHVHQERRPLQAVLVQPDDDRGGAGLVGAHRSGARRHDVLLPGRPTSSACSPTRPATVSSATTAGRRWTCSASPWPGTCRA